MLLHEKHVVFSLYMMKRLFDSSSHQTSIMNCQTRQTHLLQLGHLPAAAAVALFNEAISSVNCKRSISSI